MKCIGKGQSLRRDPFLDLACPSCTHQLSKVLARRRPMAPVPCWCRWDLEPEPCLVDWPPPPAEADDAVALVVAAALEVSWLSIHQLDLPVPSFCTRTNLLCSDRLCRMEF